MLLTPLLLTALAQAAPPADWEPLYERDGVEVSSQSVPGSDIIAVRGETVIDVHISVLWSVLTVAERTPEWADLLLSNTHLEVISENERVVKHIYDMPWPVTDRDFVMNEKRSLNPEARTASFLFHSVDAPLTEGLVRGTASRTFWQFTAIDDSHTHVVLEAHATPNGRLPVFLVNYIQRDWPYENIDGLRKQAHKPDIGRHPACEGW